MTLPITVFSFFSYHTKRINSTLLWICTVIDHRGNQNVARPSVTHLAVPCVPFCSYPHFDIICDLLLNRWTAIWSLLIILQLDHF